MKKIVAVSPYHHKTGSNFKQFPFKAWASNGGATEPSHYPKEKFISLAYKVEFPTLFGKKDVAQLRFAEALSLSFDTFPGYICHEIIPFVWDCWPMYFEKTCRWFKRHGVRTAIFTSSQTAQRMRERFPEMNILAVTEGIDTGMFEGGRQLSERTINLFEMGSVKRGYFKRKYPDHYRRLFNKPEGWVNDGPEGLRLFLQNSRLTVIFPRSITEPETAGGIETLTQRYWECMLSRIVMVGHAPKELVDLVGYNPVVEMDMEHDLEQVDALLTHIEDYQPLVDRNRETALRLGSWDIRMRQVMEWLRGVGYEV